MREVIALDVLADGVPEVIAHDDALNARVRWVHVSDTAGIARLLVGGELLLSTGSSWPEDPAAITRFIADLASAGLAGIVLELGVHYRYVPAVVIEAAREHGLPLIVLHREIRFVSVTETVHRRIIAGQTDALHARDDVRERFTALALRGSPADFVVAQLATTLGAPVVLENLAHQVVTAHTALADDRVVFADWERRSRAAHASGDLLIVPIEARGTRWGYLVALPGPDHPAGRLAVLEQGAIALALGRLADGALDDWARIRSARLLDDLLEGRYATLDGQAARLEAAGLRIRDMQVLGMLASAHEVDPDAAASAARARGGDVVLASNMRGSTMLLLALPSSTAVTTAFLEGFAADLGAPPSLVLSVGSVGVGVDAAAASLREAVELARTGDLRGPVVRTAQHSPLGRLVSALRDDHRMLDHGERMLAPLVRHDLERGGDLLDVLAAALQHPGNRTAAATSSHLSRSVFYQRLGLIEQLLGADLDDGDTQTALHIALLTRRPGR